MYLVLIYQINPTDIFKQLSHSGQNFSSPQLTKSYLNKERYTGLQGSNVFKTRLINTRHFYAMTKMSKKQLRILLMCCHKQGVTILGKIQIVSKDSAKKYNLPVRVMKALGLSISRMLVKTAIYREEQKKMQLKQI